MTNIFRKNSKANKVVHEVNSIQEVHSLLQGIDGRILFGFDKDETLTICKQHFGTSRWSYAYMDAMEKLHECKKKAFDATMQRYIHAQIHSEVDPVEGEHTVNFVRWAHEQDHQVLIVTARGSILAEATERQLNSHDIWFNRTHAFKNRNVDLTTHIPHCHALNGVVYAHGGDKGVCLERYLDAIQHDLTTFDYIVAVDDKAENIENLATCADRLGKSFIGFRYGALDHLSDDIHLPLADLQYQLHIEGVTPTIIPDDVARSMLASTDLLNISAQK